MAEYIEREATIELLRSLGSRDYRREKGTIQEAIKMVSFPEYTPAADVAPVHHGRWISLTECANEGVYCSICKKKVWKSDYAWCSKRSRNKLRSNYCPNCGAKMEGSELSDNN